MINKPCLTAILLFSTMTLVASYYEFKIQSMEDGAFIPLPKNKHIGEEIGEDAYRTSPNSLVVGDGIGGAEFSSAFIATTVCGAIERLYLNDLEVGKSTEKHAENVKDAIKKELKSFKKQQDEFFNEAHPVELPDNQYLNANEVISATTIVSAKLENLDNGKRARVDIFQKGDSLMAVFRLRKVEETRECEEYFYDLVFYTNEQQFEFNHPHQYRESIFEYEVADNESLSVDVQEDDIVILGSDGLFDNISWPFLTLMINVLMKEISNEQKDQKEAYNILVKHVQQYLALMRKNKETIAKYFDEKTYLNDQPYSNRSPERQSAIKYQSTSPKKNSPENNFMKNQEDFNKIRSKYQTQERSDIIYNKRQIDESSREKVNREDLTPRKNNNSPSIENSYSKYLELLQSKVRVSREIPSEREPDTSPYQKENHRRSNSLKFDTGSPHHYDVHIKGSKFSEEKEYLVARPVSGHSRDISFMNSKTKDLSPYNDFSFQNKASSKSPIETSRYLDISYKVDNPRLKSNDRHEKLMNNFFVENSIKEHSRKNLGPSIQSIEENEKGTYISKRGEGREQNGHIQRSEKSMTEKQILDIINLAEMKDPQFNFKGRRPASHQKEINQNQRFVPVYNEASSDIQHAEDKFTSPLKQNNLRNILDLSNTKVNDSKSKASPLRVQRTLDFSEIDMYNIDPFIKEKLMDKTKNSDWQTITRSKENKPVNKQKSLELAADRKIKLINYKCLSRPKTPTPPIGLGKGRMLANSPKVLDKLKRMRENFVRGNVNQLSTSHTIEGTPYRRIEQVTPTKNFDHSPSIRESRTPVRTNFDSPNRFSAQNSNISHHRKPTIIDIYQNANPIHFLWESSDHKYPFIHPSIRTLIKRNFSISGEKIKDMRDHFEAKSFSLVLANAVKFLTVNDNDFNPCPFWVRAVKANKSKHYPPKSKNDDITIASGLVTKVSRPTNLDNLKTQNDSYMTENYKKLKVAISNFKKYMVKKYQKTVSPQPQSSLKSSI
jgi:serine/threonine protein phosphatase PrpC